MSNEFEEMIHELLLELFRSSGAAPTTGPSLTRFNILTKKFAKTFEVAINRRLIEVIKSKLEGPIQEGFKDLEDRVKSLEYGNRE